MSKRTILLNGVSGSGKSTVIKTLIDSEYKDVLNTISPKTYRKGTTSTNVKYTFGLFDELSIGEIIINDFSDAWTEHNKKLKEDFSTSKDVSLYDEDYNRDLFFKKINDEFNKERFIEGIQIKFENPDSKTQLESIIKAMTVPEILNLINKNKIDEYILSIEINLPISNQLNNILKKHNLIQLSIVDTKGLGQDNKSRHLNFSNIDGIIFINDGSKLTDIYQSEIKKDFKNFSKSTPILIALRHTFDIRFESLSKFNNTLMVNTDTTQYLQCLENYCSNSKNTAFDEIREILEACGLHNNGIVKKIVDKYAFNALPEDYSKNNQLDGIFAEKTEEFYFSAVLQMINKCLLAIEEYEEVYNQASLFLKTSSDIINSEFTDPSEFGCYMVKQIDSENRRNAKILRAYPDSLGKYGWIKYALSNDNYEKRRLRISLYNVIELAIDYSMTNLTNNNIITKNIAEVLTVYFSIELKKKSSWVSMGYDRLGISVKTLNEAIKYLYNIQKQDNLETLNWHYISIHKINERYSCEASAIFELYLGVLNSLNLVKFNPSTLDKAMFTPTP